MFELESALRRVIELEGSDLHLKVPSPPLIRLHGRLEPIPGADPLTPEDTEGVLKNLLSNEKDKDKLEEFAHENEVDFAFGVSGLSRFRVNAFRQRGVISLVCRAIPHEIKSIEQLGLPEVISQIADEERGIILLTGTTGSGKSSTLAAMIDQINRFHSKHIVTIEDPIEFLHRDNRSIINQREAGQDTNSFKRALRRVLRQDPDVILVGELRDEATAATPLSAAEAGHLVLWRLQATRGGARRPSPRRGPPRRPAPSSSGRPTRPPRGSPPPASPPSSRRIRASRCARCSPARSRPSCPSAWCAPRTPAAASPAAR